MHLNGKNGCKVTMHCRLNITGHDLQERVLIVQCMSAVFISGSPRIASFMHDGRNGKRNVSK